MSCCGNRWSLAQKANHFVESMTTTAKNAVTGQQVIIEEVEHKARLKQCQGCPELKRFHDGVPSNADVGMGDSCKVCGCFVSVKAKLKYEACPLEKW